ALDPAAGGERSRRRRPVPGLRRRTVAPGSPLLRGRARAVWGPGGGGRVRLTEEGAAVVAAFYSTLTPALVREVVPAPPSAADGWQGWPEGAWQKEFGNALPGSLPTARPA